MPLVIVSYVMANVAYFLVLPVSAINSSNTVAVQFGQKVFGSVGALILALIVSASCFGALNATTFTSSRLVYAAGKSSSDNASQIAAIENMTTAGVKGILITVADGKAENPAIAKARKSSSRHPRQ